MSSVDWDLIGSYVGLLTLAVGSIYAGSFGSLPSVSKVTKKSKKEATDDDDSEDEDEVPERMSSEDAWMFPLIGSFALFGMYMIVKLYGTEWINWALGWYFTITGVGSVWKSSTALARLILGKSRWRQYRKWRLNLRSGGHEHFKLAWRTPTLILFPIGALPSILYAFSRKSAFLTNILSLSFSHNALSLLKIDSFKTGTILLTGLFFYDIWWVFGTEVMVKVATSLDIPIKLLWPKSLVFSSARGYTMLGLGDIVIPGTFIALALRFDVYCADLTPGKGKGVRYPYFYATLCSYIAGLVTTMTVMHVFGAAQPALLYLSPACILSFIITSAVRGEIKAAWDWEDDPEKVKKKKTDGENAEQVGTNGKEKVS